LPALPKVDLGKHEFTLDAQEFCNAPVLLATFRSRQRLIDYGKALSNLAGTAERFRQLAEKCQMTEEPRFGDLGKRRAENLQAIDEVALLNEQHTPE
jgi:hypothetical protein